MSSSVEVSSPVPVDVTAHAGAIGKNADHKMTVTVCANAVSNFRVFKDAPWGFVCESFIADHVERASKDGPAIIFAEMRDGRFNHNAQFGTALAYEIDGKLSLDQVDDIVNKCEYEAVVWTTHNHLRTMQCVGVATYRKWHVNNFGRYDLPTDETVRQFCSDNKRYDHLINVRLHKGGLPRLVREFGQNVEVFDIEHDPEHKLRIVFPLRDSIPLKDNEIGIAEFKAIYHSHGKRIFGDRYSVESANPARIHYLPSHVPGSEFDVRHYAGTLVDPFFIWKSIKSEHIARCAKPARARLPATGSNELEHVLKSIPADVEYPEWFKVIAAIFHETSGSGDGNELAHAWSGGDPRYDFDQVERIWDNLDPDHPKSSTMGSLVALAREHDPGFRPYTNIRTGFQLLEKMITRKQT